MSGGSVILELKKLKKYFPLKRGVNLRALEDISFKIYKGEKFGVVGESGCGKSTLGRVILQLYHETSGACIYYGRTLEEMYPKYLEKELSNLPVYQDKARKFYEKSLAVDRQIAELEGKQDGHDREPIETLRKKSKELKKEASRALREGSRTAGSLILSGKLPEIKNLLMRAQEEAGLAHEALAACSRLEAELEKNRMAGAPSNPELAKKLKEAREKAETCAKKAQEHREQAFSYRGKDILPLTERCLDPAYQAKLDANYETGINLGKLTNREMRTLRREMQMIFQDPAASLDPRQSVGSAIEEVFVINTDDSPDARREKTMTLLEKVGLKREHYDSYPHELSGGQKQRVGIARAIALDPKFVVLDESVSALDVSVQAQILHLLDDLSRGKHLTYFFITHDLGVVKYFCDRILVMYLGNVCELAPSKTLFRRPLHPYTDSLLASVPRPVVRDTVKEEKVLEGEVPSSVNPPKGCPFHTRCPRCMDVCRQDKPLLTEVEEGHFVACHLHTACGSGRKNQEEAK